MLKILKNQPAAWALSVIVMIAALLFGVRLSGTRQAKQVEALFYEGTNSVGSTNTVAIAELLDERADNAIGLLTLCDAHPELELYSRALDEARAELMNADSIPAAYAANCALTEAADALEQAAQSAGLSERERQGFALYLNGLRGAQTVIEQNSYNEKVLAFDRDVLGAFPMRLLRDAAGIRAPELFGDSR